MHLQRSMYKETVFKETFLISIVNITAYETGIILCNASNEFGIGIHESTFLVTGTYIFLNLFYIHYTEILNYNFISIKKINHKLYYS